MAGTHARSCGAPERRREAVWNGDGGKLGILDARRPPAIRRVGGRLVRRRAAHVRLGLAGLPACHVVRGRGRRAGGSTGADVRRRPGTHLRSERRKRLPAARWLMLTSWPPL